MATTLSRWPHAHGRRHYLAPVLHRSLRQFDGFVCRHGSHGRLCWTGRRRPQRRRTGLRDSLVQCVGRLPRLGDADQALRGLEAEPPARIPNPRVSATLAAVPRITSPPTRPTARHASSASPGRITRVPRAELGWWSSSVRPRPRNKSPLRLFHGKYSEIVWLPTGRTAPTSTNADALTGLPNTYVPCASMNVHTCRLQAA